MTAMPSYYVDFHTHLHAYPDHSQAGKEIREHKIISVAASMDIASYQATKEMVKDNPWIIPTFGIHPKYSGSVVSLSDLDAYLEDSPIIGEIGLDECWHADVPQAVQEKVFEYILDHCHRKRKYCVIHTKDAEARVLEMLKSFPDAKPIIHWYDGPADIFRKMLNKGYYTTFGCQVKYSEHIKELLRLTPEEQILSETDNPDSEKWLGGTDSSPALIHRVVRDIAEVKGISESVCRKIIYGNSREILVNLPINPPKYTYQSPCFFSHQQHCQGLPYQARYSQALKDRPLPLLL